MSGGGKCGKIAVWGIFCEIFGAVAVSIYIQGGSGSRGVPLDNGLWIVLRPAGCMARGSSAYYN